jgi:hypothetical protein
MPFAMGRVPPLASPFPESEEIIDLFGEKRYARTDSPGRKQSPRCPTDTGGFPRSQFVHPIIVGRVREPGEEHYRFLAVAGEVAAAAKLTHV